MAMKKIIFCALLCIAMSACKSGNRNIIFYTSFNPGLMNVENKDAEKKVCSNILSNGNCFYHVKSNDIIFIWTYFTIKEQNIIEVSRVNDTGSILNISYAYPYSIEWINEIDLMDYYVYQSKYLPIVQTNSFYFYGRDKTISFTSTLEQDKPIEVDTLSNIFMRNELRDYRDYIVPLENSEYKIIR